ncbi:E3 ubiquitin-protein ligase KEG [Labeo rohita]|uniref:E3 ubiquitin-protein ligase KEG n=1 Tax=Labeo rohita TaxID=84645 RepID=A0ABQ8MLT7_LABRO|nr:E3 ubiquitin-protein ligase KEG [Labeo rohita]
MVLFEDQECGVCYLHYSRIERVPRTLHCNHTFCTPCLETMGLHYSGLRTIRCPLCRQVTCVDRGLSLQEALFVNSQLWDNICDEEEEEEDKREQEKVEEGEVNANMQRNHVMAKDFIRRYFLKSGTDTTNKGLAIETVDFHCLFCCCH